MTQAEPAERRPSHSLPALLFGFEAPVNAKTYAVAGFSLMALKYAVDATAIHLATQKFWTPLDYLSPLLAARHQHFGNDHDLLQLALLAWTLPFVWIGASMTMRRAADANVPPLIGALFFFAPLFNYVWMLLLCLLPTVRRAPSTRRADSSTGIAWTRFAKAVFAAVVVASLAFATSVLVFRSYGSMVFVGAPMLLGATGSLVYGAAGQRPWKEAALVSIVSTVFVSATLLLFAAEGVFCIAMALPLALPMSLLGGLIGHGISSLGRPTRATAAAVPIFWLAASWFEAENARASPGRATTTVAVAAPRETVWKHVVSFSELPPPEEFYFRLGIAYPLRARIRGSGVGAVRHCEFSTGPFVEPITTWDEPAHLAFDVVAEPAALEELSPYDELAPPHLDGFFSSRRGEFRLHATDSGTQLDGTTWYELQLEPAPYWRLWTDALVHRIHARVLDHVRSLAEADVGPDSKR